MAQKLLADRANLSLESLTVRISSLRIDAAQLREYVSPLGYELDENLLVRLTHKHIRQTIAISFLCLKLIQCKCDRQLEEVA